MHGFGNPFRAFWLRPRLLGAVLLVPILALLLPLASPWTRLLAGWCIGVVVYVGLVAARAWRAPKDSLKDEASNLDDSSLVVVFFALLATAASFGAVVMVVFGEREQGANRIVDLALAGATMLLSWLFVQVVFALHYAHLYYGLGTDLRARGGLDFPEDDAPDFWDFLYFSVTMGATAQTSDTGITSKLMRRVATLHAIHAYLFNTSLLALAINMAASAVAQ